MEKNEIREQWDCRAIENSIDINRKPEHFFWDRYEKDIILKHIKSEDSILDIGCGTGRITTYLYKLGYNVTGIDYSKKAIEKLRKNHPEISCRMMDILDLPMKNKFDVIILTRTLQSLPTKEMKIEALAKAKQSMNTNGTIILTEGNPNRLYAPIPKYNYYLTYKEWLAVLKDSNLKLIEISSIPFSTLVSLCDGKSRYWFVRHFKTLYNVAYLLDFLGRIKPDWVSGEFTFVLKNMNYDIHNK